MCQCCNITTIAQMNFHCGHIISEFNGGKITIDNLIPLCQLCNSSMGKTNLNEFMEAHGLLTNNTLKEINFFIVDDTQI